jgi:hypothetical protein
MKFFLTPLATSVLLRSKKNQTMLILAFEANSALSRENETKIVKIIHSARMIFIFCCGFNGYLSFKCKENH